MPMRLTTLRLSESTYEALTKEAKLEGVSAAQYVRELVIAHLARLDERREHQERNGGSKD